MIWRFDDLGMEVLLNGMFLSVSKYLRQIISPPGGSGRDQHIPDPLIKIKLSLHTLYSLRIGVKLFFFLPAAKAAGYSCSVQFSFVLLFSFLPALLFLWPLAKT